MASPIVLAQMAGSLAYVDGGAGGTGSSSGPLRYRDGHNPPTDVALIEAAVTNYLPNPSIETNTTGWSGSSTRTRVTLPEYVGGWSLQSTAASPGQGIAATTSVTYQPAAVAGETWTLSFYYIGAVGGEQATAYLEGVLSPGGTITEDETLVITATTSWQRAVLPITLAGGTTANIKYRVLHTAATTIYFDGLQLEKKPTATSYIDGAQGTGYAWTGSAHASTSTRAVTTVSIPCATEPDQVSCRYSEDLGATWQVAHLTTLAASNLGSYGTITHDGDSLEISSSCSLLIGPVFAFGDVLNTTQRALLEDTDTWTFDMLTTEGRFITASAAGTHPTAPIITMT